MPRPRVSRGGSEVFPGGTLEQREGAGPGAEAGPQRQVRSSCTCDWVKLSFSFAIAKELGKGRGF